jgi:peptidoglycan/LPS O-acetylase OafA/YrhL
VVAGARRPPCLDLFFSLHSGRPALISTATTARPDTVTIDRRGSNSYDFVRFCAAAAVLFSHHFDLVGMDEPLVPGLGEDFGQVAVEVFFCLSGFLLTLSLQKSRGFAFFAFARVMRITPNLVFALVAGSLVTLAWYRNLPHLWDHVAYVRDNMLMFVEGVRFGIAGVFTDTVRAAVNEPIWTLPYEVWCYVVLTALFAAGARLSSALVVVAALVASLFWGLVDLDGVDLGPLEGFDFARLASYFLAGAAVAVVWPWMKRHAVAYGGVALVALVAVRSLIPIDTLLSSLALAVATIGLGSSRALAWFARGGDASYGIYVFAWPIQQFSLLLIASFWGSMLAAFVVTAALGYATWHGFEKRAIALPHRWAKRRRARPMAAAATDPAG